MPSALLFAPPLLNCAMLFARLPACPRVQQERSKKDEVPSLFSNSLASWHILYFCTLGFYSIRACLLAPISNHQVSPDTRWKLAKILSFGRSVHCPPSVVEDIIECPTGSKVSEHAR